MQADEAFFAGDAQHADSSLIAIEDALIVEEEAGIAGLFEEEAEFGFGGDAFGDIVDHDEAGGIIEPIDKVGGDWRQWPARGPAR